MQIKNIILSLAAAIALVQATPMGVPPAPPATTPNAKAYTFGSCYDQGVAPPNTGHPTVQADPLTAAMSCGSCMDGAVAECREDVCESVDADCYNDSMEKCMSKLGYLGKASPLTGSVPATPRK